MILLEIPNYEESVLANENVCAVADEEDDLFFKGRKYESVFALLTIQRCLVFGLVRVLLVGIVFQEIYELECICACVRVVLFWSMLEKL